MRIVAGLHRGRILKTPANHAIRPTSDKVRQALFNALQSRGLVVDAVVLDAFCGTGALGLEALSQGAARAVFFDQAKTSLTLATANAALLRETERCEFLHCDATAPGPRPAHLPAATLCFLDPPYHKNLVPQAVAALVHQNWLTPECCLVCETEKAADLGSIDAIPLFEKTYGETSVVVFARRAG